MEGAMNEFADCRELASRLGRRLRELRLESGLTQGDLALRMGYPTPAMRIWVSKAERGKTPNVSARMLAAWLRALRAGVGDLADVFDRFTSRPTVVEERERQRLGLA